MVGQASMQALQPVQASLSMSTTCIRVPRNGSTGQERRQSVFALGTDHRTVEEISPSTSTFSQTSLGLCLQPPGRRSQLAGVQPVLDELAS